MTLSVLDSSIWIEYFAERPKADKVEPLMHDPARLIVPAVTIYEVYKRLKAGFDEGIATTAVGRMILSPIVPVDAELAMRAADVSLETKLAMADSLVLATARVHGAELITLDSDFKGLPGVRVL